MPDYFLAERNHFLESTLVAWQLRGDGKTLASCLPCQSASESAPGP